MTEDQIAKLLKHTSDLLGAEVRTVDEALEALVRGGIRRGRRLPVRPLVIDPRHERSVHTFQDARGLVVGYGASMRVTDAWVHKLHSRSVPYTPTVHFVRAMVESVHGYWLSVFCEDDSVWAPEQLQRANPPGPCPMCGTTQNVPDEVEQALAKACLECRLWRVLTWIEGVYTLGRTRMLIASPEERALRPAELDWLHYPEQTRLESLLHVYLQAASQHPLHDTSRDAARRADARRAARLANEGSER